MSGHNKWSKIKHKKEAEDKKKSKVFSILSRTITLESKKAGGDVNSPSLRTVIEKARAANMPKDNIDRAVAKGIGTGEAIEEVTYEGYGPGGAALIIPCVTDNTNRTRAEIKALFSKRGYALGEPGCAAWAFEKKDGAFVARDPLDISDTDKESLADLMDTLEDHGDVDAVYTNAAL